ncbi:bifunctional diguanylate cyclase/phosphodiesterase [Sphingomonas montanisoli]|uniref:bifunctional diguanylate cyclase/phosphodiesterase n=1 Tax=Sphingomonas montanisoli TaxID=2606412 RepID=UPI001FE7CF0E|nr:EAL domain-containing protein [Sphingomonas montanisoli]
MVALAGLVCGLTCLAAVTLLRQQRGETPSIDRRWRLTAGVMTGFGIWSAHFVAMLGYNTGPVVVGYAYGPTALSLMVAIGVTIGGFMLPYVRNLSLPFLAAGGALVGAGIVAMHYIGMSAVEFPGHFGWDAELVALSALSAVAFAIPALVLALRTRGSASGLAAGGLLMLAILTLHFTGMMALQVVPDADGGQGENILSPVTLGIVIGALAFAVLLIGIGASVINATAVAAIRSQGREFRILVEGITDCALYMLSLDGRVVSWNAGAAQLKGFTSDEAIGLNFASFYSQEDQAAGIPQRAIAAARDAGKFTAEGWRHRKDGSRFWANVTIEAVVDEQGDIIGFAKLTRDISRQKEDQDRLIALTEKLDAALTNMHQGLALFDREERVALVNARFRMMYRLDPDLPLEGLSFSDFMRTSLLARGNVIVDQQRIEAGRGWLRACLAQPGGGGSVTTNFDDGGVVDISYQALPEGGFVATFEDVSERHRSEARIAHMAMHDDLTGLPNRTNFNGQVDDALRRAEAGHSKVALVVIDLDGFKEINDTYGHATGDRILGSLGHRMSAMLGDGQVFARFGGDEFAASYSFDDETELTTFLDQLRQVLDTPVEANGLEIKPSACLGVALFPDDGSDREQVLSNADLAMYRAKATHGVQLCQYEYGMDEVARKRRSMAADLRDAIAANDLSLAYQVQRSLVTNEVTGYEALARWHHPVAGWIAPQEFISVAEESGCIIELGDCVLRRACREAVLWPEPYRVAVNLSPVQLTRPILATTVAEILLETGLPPSRLELEITETALIADKASALHILRQIKAMGVSIAIDDFGTGYSSLETLHSFPFDKIKIDRSFVMESDRSEQARAIIRAVIALGSTIGMPVLAEGVETEAQLEMLRSEGCSEAQGFLLGRPSLSGPVLNEQIRTLQVVANSS